MTLLERVRQALAPSFRVERELGEGGMGVVFLGHDPTLERPVAIKVLRPEVATAVAVERFLREARLLARLRHPNIIQIHQAGDAGGLLYFVMDYAAGETLVARLRRGPLTVEEGMVVAVDVLDALTAAHRLGIIHRDVKPGNVFLVDGRAYLADFGIAKTLGGSDSEPGLTVEGRQIGTPGSMAPEQLAGEPATAASDIYATGLLLYECLSGHRWTPMQAPENGDWSGIPPRVALALRKAMALDRDQRWASADAFRAALVGKATHSRWKIATALGVAAVVGFGVWRLVRPPAQAVERPVLEIADFDVPDSADRPVADKLADAIVFNLSGAPDFEVRRGAGRKPSVFRLTGRLSRHRDSLVVDARLTAGDSPQPLTVAALAGQEDALADALANELLLKVMGDDNDWLPYRALPKTSAGLSQWRRAERLYFRAQWDSAAQLYREAERQHVDCILCSYRYNDVQRWLEQTPDPARVSRVRRDIDSFPPHYQALIRAEQIPLPARIDTLRGIAEDQYRDFSEAWYRYGEEVFHRGPLYGMDRMDALRLLWHATGPDTSFQPPLFDIATLLISEGDSAGAARARAHLGRFRGTGLTAARQVLPEIAFVMRFGRDGLSDGVTIARDVLRDPRVRYVAEVPAGPRLLHVFGLPEGAVALGEAFERSYPDFANSGLVAQITGHAARGQLDAMRAAASRLQARGTTPHLAHYPMLLELALLLFDDSLPEGYRSRVDSVVARLARPGIEPATDRWAAAWMLAVLAYRQRDSSRAQRHARILDDEPPPRVRGRFLSAWMSAARGDFRQALVVSLALTADSVIILNEAYDDLFLRAALKLSRAEWQAGMQNWDEVRGDLRWHKHWQMTDRPVADPKSAETDWALGTLARWRYATWFDTGQPAHELCQSLADVARHWKEGDGRYRERAERAEARFRALGCPGRP